MPIVCPACNKPNQADAACQRCGCDLARLHEVGAAAAASLGDATSALVDCNWPVAFAAAVRSWRLRHTMESARIAFLAAAASGDTAQALRWHRRVAEDESS